MVPRAIGRRDEIDRISSALDAAGSGDAGMVFEIDGEAGIGKSCVLDEIVAMARAKEWRVWSVSPTASEAGLPWTALAQIVVGLGAKELGELAGVHLDPIASAIAATRSEPVSPELVAFGLSALLDAAAREQGLLLAIDDVQWLDAASAAAFAYALRGTPRRRMLAVLARRRGEPAPIEPAPIEPAPIEPAPIEPARLVPAQSYQRISLAGLGLADLREIAGAATGAVLSRAELVGIAERTGGNPLYAIELARMIAGGRSLDTAVLPSSLRDSVGVRVHALPAATRRALGVAALAARPTLDRLVRALGDPDLLAALGPAESAGVIELRQAAPDGPLSVTFAHPLLAAAAIDDLTTSDRRELHAALAASSTDNVERAGHLIAGGAALDAAAADELEAAALDARAAGAAETAAMLAHACLAATPTGLARLRRVEMCARLDSVIGRYGDAEELLGEVWSDLEDAIAGDDPVAAAARNLRERCADTAVVVAANRQGFAAAEAAAWKALTLTADPHRRFLLHSRLVRSILHQDIRRGVGVAEMVFGADSEHQGVDRLLGALVLLTARAAAGEPFDANEAIGRVESTVSDQDQGPFASLLVEPLVWSDHPRSIEIAERAIGHHRDRGHIAAELSDRYQVVDYLIARGDWRGAEEMIERLEEYAGQFPDGAGVVADRALLLAACGEPDRAELLIARALAELNASTEGEVSRLVVLSRAGIVAHTLGRESAADDLLDVERRFHLLGVHSVRGPKFRRDLVESLVGAGRITEAAAAAERLIADAERNQLPTAVAESNAAAGVVAAASGSHAAARNHFVAAIETQRRYGLRYELARTLLAAGVASRRAKRRAEAGERIAEARELFVSMGAVTWAHRCDGNSARLGVNQATSSAELTPTEREVAEAVSSGMTNRQVADALFIGLRTVESHLSRAYRKLGIKSRAGLGRRLRERYPDH